MALTTISTGGLTADIAVVGAELVSLRNASGAELLWDAGPQWRRHAPLLFPCIGQSPENLITVDGAAYPMPQHGFARDLPFRGTNSSAASASFELESDERTRESYPFDFRLTATYGVTANALTSSYTVINTGSRSMPASFGLHPGFAWPGETRARTASTVTFSADESEFVRRIVDGLPLPNRVPSPISDRILHLDDAVFEGGALLLDAVASDEVGYRSSATGTLTLRWSGFEQFAVWSPTTRAAFVCLEPWAGLPAPADFHGELRDKPGQFHLEPGQHKQFTFEVLVGEE